MDKLKGLKPERVFYYFEKLCAIPHGSGDMQKIADYCVEFAKAHSLRHIRDNADNVIIFKNGTDGYQNSQPVILQGHLDMVCQKTPESSIDFTKDGLDIYVDGDYIKAKGTTLGGDDGIAVAMALAILESDNIPHPPLEVVFTTDEEIGMCGAIALDCAPLKGRKLINIDSESQSVITVSCAGGSDFEMSLDITRKKTNATIMTLAVKGLLGGHSGVEIDKGRVNANLVMARLLNSLNADEFELISICGGDKANAIPLYASAEICTNDAQKITMLLNEQKDTIAKEISAKEPGFCLEISAKNFCECEIIENKETVLNLLMSAQSGVIDMSKEIEGLVETSQNLGILKTEKDCVTIHFSLRSNKKSALRYTEQRLIALSKLAGANCKAFGHYPPWEFKSDSVLSPLYQRLYKEKLGEKPSVEAIHAGLECGVFSDKLDCLDCISIGPDIPDIHTVAERLSIKSTETVFELVKQLLKECK